MHTMLVEMAKKENSKRLWWKNTEINTISVQEQMLSCKKIVAPRTLLSTKAAEG